MLDYYQLLFSCLSIPDCLPSSAIQAQNAFSWYSGSTSLLVSMQRSMGNDEWDLMGIAKVLSESNLEKIPFPNAKDYIRLRLNYEYGKVGMSKATVQYSKGKEYVEQLRKEINNM